MNKKKQISSKLITILFVIGAILVAAGALLWLKTKEFSGWMVAIGGVVMSISFLINAFQKKENESFRARRLERMQLFSGLLYLVSGGFMIQRSGSWLPIFLIATVFFVYSAFVTDKSAKK